ncbi:MAG: hypothetical protein JKY13_03215 [Gammaproteobacteria bacterium]|nr:hypothetical protein [Gammaproteobacteria bacterium]
MNGFDSHIRDKVFSLAPQVSFQGLNNQLANWQQVERKLLTRKKNYCGSALCTRARIVKAF